MSMASEMPTTPRTLVRSCLLGLAGLVVNLPATAQTVQAAASGQSPPMGRQSEIVLALSACPPALQTKAAVYVLDTSGYIKVRDSQNGFTAIVTATT